MKAITYNAYGPPDVLEISNVPKPAPGDDEVLVRVCAAEATKADCELRGFKFSVKWFWLPLRLAFGITRPRRNILGGYFSGVVADVGKDVSRLSVGDEVFGATGLRLGAYGEYVALPASYTIAQKPANMSFVEAAAVPLGGLNALHFMRLAQIENGDEILINGAGGSIGAHAVQIAKTLGAEVTAVDKAVKESAIRNWGADDFIDYEREDFRRSGRRYDAIFDMVPNGSYSGCIRSLKQGGRYLNGNPRLGVMMRSVLTNWFSNKSATFAFAGETQDELNDLRTLIENGQMQSIVHRSFPMEHAAAAHRMVEEESRLGAIVLTIGTTSAPEI